LRYETNLPRLFSLFRGRAIAQAVAQALEQGKKISVYRTYAPNRLQIALAPAELEPLRPELEALTATARKALEEARERAGFFLVGPPEISFVGDAKLPRGRLVIEAGFSVPAPRPLRLRLLKGQGPALFPLTALGESAILGRAEEAELKLPDGTVSRRHARLYRKDGGWRIAELKGENGVYLNGVKISDQPLSAGDRIGLGAVELLVEAE
jgi:hypothetical protein